jgi:galactose-1-phosphate uridylyltransferase
MTRTNQHLTREKMMKLHKRVNLRNILDVFEETRKNAPSHFSLDSRYGEPIVFSEKRMGRPYDNSNNSAKNDSCAICEGKTTTVLSYGKSINDSFPFSNENMFPAIIPNGISLAGPLSELVLKMLGTDSHDSAKGVHLLHWPSNYHIDIHQMKRDEVKNMLMNIVECENIFENIDPTTYKYSTLIKNTGKVAGGSLEHGHFQEVISNLPPGYVIDDYIGNCLGIKNPPQIMRESMKGKNPSTHVVERHGNFSIVSPYNAQKPLEQRIICNEPGRNRLADFEEGELGDLACALIWSTRGLYHAMPAMGKEFAYNMEINQSPLGEFSIDIFPATQTRAGLEMLGYNICQMTPKKSANILKLARSVYSSHPFDKYEISPEKSSGFKEKANRDHDMFFG